MRKKATFHNKMKTLWLILLVVLARAASIAQAPDLNPEKDLKGKIESITEQRTYYVWNMRSIAHPVPRIYFLDRYNKNGLLIQSSDFGNIERRIVVDRSDPSHPLRTVLYFNFAGGPLSDGATHYSPLWKENPGENPKLCDEFILSQTVAGNVITFSETCSDGSFRSQQSFEKNDKSQVIRASSKDARNRTSISKMNTIPRAMSRDIRKR